MGLFDGDPNKGHSPFELPPRSSLGKPWGGQTDGFEDATVVASTSSGDNVIQDGFPKLGTCFKEIQKLEKIALLLEILEETEEEVCGDEELGDVCATTRMNLSIARAALNAARAAVQKECFKGT